jgi:hypothetical protein
MELYLTTIEYVGDEVGVLTETPEQGKKALLDMMRGDGLGLRYYATKTEFVEEASTTTKMTIGEVTRI